MATQSKGPFNPGDTVGHKTGGPKWLVTFVSDDEISVRRWDQANNVLVRETGAPVEWASISDSKQESSSPPNCCL